MRKKFYVIIGLMSIFLLGSLTSNAQVDKILGIWKTIDDVTGEAKSHVKIFKATNGKFYGRIEKLLKDPADKKCTACTGSNKNKPIVGLIFVNDMKAEDGELVDGTILDPANGKTYHCTISLDPKDSKKLIVRGSLDSWGIAGRSQTWIKLD